MVFKTLLYKNGDLKLTEYHGSEISAVRSGQNWRMIGRGNSHTFEVVEKPEEKVKSLGSHIKDLMRGFY